MGRLLRPGAIAGLLALALACDAGLSPTDVGSLLRAERQWEAEGPSNYRVETQLLCFCPEGQWAQLTVHNDTITHVVDELGDSVPQAQWGRRLTVRASFPFIRSLMSGNWKDIDFNFDGATGLPLRAVFAPGGDVLDGGAGIAFRNLEPLSPE